MNGRTTFQFQFQFAKSIPDAAGAPCTATFNSPCCAELGAGWTTGLLKSHADRALLAKTLNPVTNRVGMNPIQSKTW